MNVVGLTATLQDTGRFHWLLLCGFAFTWSVVSFNTVAMAFYGFAPPLPRDCASNFGRNPGNASNISSTAVFNITVIRASEDHDGVCSASGNGSEMGISTIVTEWNLYGSRQWMVSLSATLYFAGVMIGGLLMGSLADRFGRKKVLLVCLSAPVPLGIALYFMPFYEGYVALRFVLGICVQGVSSVSVVNCVEFFSARHKLRAIVVFESAWALSLMLLALLANELPGWRQLQIAITCIPAIALVYAWWLPESPRWLTVQKKHAELLRIFETGARINGMKIDPDDLTACKNEIAAMPADSGTDGKAASREEAQQLYTLVDMVRTPQLRRRSLVFFFVWFTVMMSYYSLTFGIRPLHPSRYLSFFINAATELIAFWCDGLILKRFGRRIPLIVSTVSAGVLCITCGVVASNTGGDEAALVAAVLALFGRSFVAASLLTLFIWTSELFPTVIRSMAVGTCGFWMSAGSLVAPQLLLLGQYTWTELPIVVVGVSCCVGGATVSLLPETKDKPLPDSIADVESSSSPVATDNIDMSAQYASPSSKAMKQDAC